MGRARRGREREEGEERGRTGGERREEREEGDAWDTSKGNYLLVTDPIPCLIEFKFEKQ